MKKVLVANRGEIACRIIKALKKLSIHAVAIYSTADKNAEHVKLADSSICIGPPKAMDSYLNISRIIAACELCNVDGVHPGYGFLSENPLFAEIVEKSGLVFIGPSSDLIHALGNKIQAKKIAKRAKCPVIPGSEGEIQSLNEGIKTAKEIGYPVFIKASAGGGGKGITIASNEGEFSLAYFKAKTEALHLFNDSSIYIEKMIVNPKHIEVQIIGDHHGTVIHAYERDCSLQRRRQKLIEETPSVALSSSLREQICQAAVSLMKEAGYHSLGTVEFLLDKEGFYFMEVNTRIQVEHTITEELVGIDLVAIQIAIAQGEKLPITQKDVKQKVGHVMEFRVNAEDSDAFIPTPGILTDYKIPSDPQVRVDTGFTKGSTVSPYYDSLLAKVIVKGNSREEVIIKSKEVLSTFSIEGVCSTLPFFLRILEGEMFNKSEHHIASIDNKVGKESVH
jgi:acetyl-CoA carboxylase biotin carboxylase subunit